MTKSRGINRLKWHPDWVALELVKRNFATSRTTDLAQVLGVAYHQVARLAHRLGLRKDPAWLNTEGWRTNGTKGLGTRFQKGQASWNRGKTGLRLSPATEFKPGVAPPNKAPLGAYRIESGGYLQVKVTETGYPPRDWQMVHRRVWIEAHGPIPVGHVVVFKDGSKRTEAGEIVPEVLECISRRENMARNTLHRYGPEVARLVQLRGALTRQINRRQQKETQA